MLKKKIADGVRCVGGWAAIPDAFACEVYAAQGWDSVTLDMQHGGSNINDAVPMLPAIQIRGRCHAADSRAVERSRPDHARAGRRRHGHHLPDDQHQGRGRSPGARRAAIRRWASAVSGPIRASQYGADYWQKANEEVLLFAMVETRQAVEQSGRDPVREGPQRRLRRPLRSVAQHGQAADARPTDKEVLTAMDTIVKTTRKKGPIAGVHTDGAKTALRRFEEGFQMCTILNDVRLLAMSAAQAVREVRGQAPAAKAKTY